MKVDIESESEAVQAFVLATIEEFHQAHGRASVQANWGQIHAYPSTHHTPETIFDDVGPPVNFIYDSDTWMAHKEANDTLEYKGQSCMPNGAAGPFNNFVSVMVYDAVLLALKKVPPEKMPKALVVEAAPEHEGIFHKLIIPDELRH